MRKQANNTEEEGSGEKNAKRTAWGGVAAEAWGQQGLLRVVAQDGETGQHKSTETK